ncbi:MAG: DUF1996 domain-containing protein [Ilumatobacteraceae bacterium]|nr:DUF1996 domain-containing protein [Ilumatobacteraceae bacterium]
MSESVIDPDSGRRGSFGVVCPFSHRNEDDPIMYPDQPGASHQHDYFGATSVAAATKWKSLKNMPNLCKSMGDLSAYWAPTLQANLLDVTPTEMAVYLRTPTEAEPSQVVAPPNGLELISVRSGWTCARTDTPQVTMPSCPSPSTTRLILEYPDCWDGKHLSSSDHFSHVAVSVHGKCPSSHDTMIPQMATELRYELKNYAPDTEYSLSSGELNTVHGDAILFWDQEVMKKEIRSCLMRRVNCDLTWFTSIQG